MILQALNRYYDILCEDDAWKSHALGIAQSA